MTQWVHFQVLIELQNYQIIEISHKLLQIILKYKFILLTSERFYWP
jgi:hypothetical protein